jgi:hypothetical protein
MQSLIGTGVALVTPFKEVIQLIRIVKGYCEFQSMVELNIL